MVSCSHSTTEQFACTNIYSPSIRQCIIVGPRPAPRSVGTAQIDKGRRIGPPHVLEAIIGYKSELPNVTSVEGDFVDPWAVLTASTHIVVKVQPKRATEAEK